MFVILLAPQHVLIAYCVSSQQRMDIKSLLITALYKQPLLEHTVLSFSVCVRIIQHGLLQYLL